MGEPLLSVDVTAGLPSVNSFISFIQECKITQNLARANIAYRCACSYGIETDKFLGNYFVPLFVDCGSLRTAEQLVNRLGFLNDHSWTSLIEGHLDCGELLHASYFYAKMQETGTPPNRLVFIRLLQACARQECLGLGTALHNDIDDSSYIYDSQIITALIRMYVKCGELQNAAILFNKMSVRDVTVWTVLISGYFEYGHCNQALTCIKQMEKEDVSPDPITLLYGLKASANTGSHHNGQSIHADIIKKGFEDDSFIGNSLVAMYSKWGFFLDAQNIFDALNSRSTITWNALIKGCIDHELWERAFTCFQLMEEDGFSPDAATFICISKACSSTDDLERGHKIHNGVLVRGWETDVFMGSSLVSMYAKFGFFEDAHSVLDRLPSRNAVSWNSLITEYAEQGIWKEALLCVQKMQLDGIDPDATTYTCSLKACGGIRDIDMIEEHHKTIKEKGYMNDPYIGSSLVDAYVKCEMLAKAQEVFEILPARHVVSWTALIVGYAESGLWEEVLLLFDQMQADGISPNSISFLCILRVCGDIGIQEIGRQIHVMIVKKGLETDISVCNALIKMYIRYSSLTEAYAVFDRLTVRNVASWNTLITGLVDGGHVNEALHYYEQMKLAVVFPDAATFSSVLNACSSMEAIEMALEMHNELSKEGFDSEPFVGSALVHAYAKFGFLPEALDVFNNISIKDLVVWTALIAGFSEKGLVSEAWEFFQQMCVYGTIPDVITWNAIIFGYAGQGDIYNLLKCYSQLQEQGSLPTSTTFVNILKGCGNISALATGKKIHALIFPSFLKSEEEGLYISLIEMYCKCGSSFSAEEAFNEMNKKKLAAWNALLTGYAHLGEYGNALNLFERKREGLNPDDLSFLSVLNACCHEGVVNKGLHYLKEMTEQYSVIPSCKHYNCLIDLYCRTGQLREAITIINEMPFEPDIVTWSIILSACQQWGNLEMGREAFHCAVRSQKCHAAAFIMMSNMYVDLGM